MSYLYSLLMFVVVFFFFLFLVQLFDDDVLDVQCILLDVELGYVLLSYLDVDVVEVHLAQQVLLPLEIVRHTR